MDRQEYGSIEVSRTSKVSIPADGENVRQQFSLKAPVEEKNLLALHNLTEKNLLGRQHTPNFNPRPPRGGRLSFSSASICCLLFQSTPPARGTTAVVPRRPPVGIISIHAPARGTTQKIMFRGADDPIFQSTPPRGGRRRRVITSWQRRLFQSTPPARGATLQIQSDSP